jgi:hypothetical protein
MQRHAVTAGVVFSQCLLVAGAANLHVDPGFPLDYLVMVASMALLATYTCLEMGA